MAGFWRNPACDEHRRVLAERRFVSAVPPPATLARALRNAGSMRTLRWRPVLVSTVAAVAAGVLLHFTLDWSGRSPLVAPFASVNESVWEHMKLAFWPCLLVATSHRVIYRPIPSWSVGAAAFALLPPAAIVLLFYAYTAIAGTNYLPVDLTIFVIAVLIGAIAAHALYERRTPGRAKMLAAALLVAFAAAFVLFTFQPPDHFLFEDPPAIVAEEAG